MSDLSRFREVHDDHRRAFAEIGAGRKRTHWMWYIFPQVAGLGHSATARRYAIADVDEARDFLSDPVLGRDYIDIVDQVWQQVTQRGVSIGDLFGSPDNAKLVSSLTLFVGVADDADIESDVRTKFISQAHDILAAAEGQGLPRCATTASLLEGTAN